jgi:hypothetical protein
MADLVSMLANRRRMMNDIDKLMVSLKLEAQKNQMALHIFKKQRAKALSKLHLTDRIAISVVPEDSMKATHA